MQLKIAQTKRKTNKTLFQVRIARFKDRIKEIIYCTRECNVGAQKISSFVLFCILWIAYIFIFKNELRKKRHNFIYLCNRSSVCTAFMKFRLIHRSIKYLINSGCVCNLLKMNSNWNEMRFQFTIGWWLFKLNHLWSNHELLSAISAIELTLNLPRCNGRRIEWMRHAFEPMAHKDYLLARTKPKQTHTHRP